jgi:hypothetical protein
LGFRFVCAAVAGATEDGGSAAMDDCGARAEGEVFGLSYRQGFGGSLPLPFAPLTDPKKKKKKVLYLTLCHKSLPKVMYT